MVITKRSPPLNKVDTRRLLAEKAKWRGMPKIELEVGLKLRIQGQGLDFVGEIEKSGGRKNVFSSRQSISSYHINSSQKKYRRGASFLQIKQIYALSISKYFC